MQKIIVAKLGVNMIDFNEWVVDISSSYRVDIYKKPTKVIGCVPLREGLEYAKQHRIVFTCYDFSSDEEKSVCRELNKMMGVEGFITSENGIKPL